MENYYQQYGLSIGLHYWAFSIIIYCNISGLWIHLFTEKKHFEFVMFRVTLMLHVEKSFHPLKTDSNEVAKNFGESNSKESETIFTAASLFVH